MPQFGSYTDGVTGQTSDEIVVKRSGTGTVRLALNKLPVTEAAAAAFADKTAFDTFQEATDLSLSQKENVLTFQQGVSGSSVTRVGNTVTIPSLASVAGNLADGKSWLVMPGFSTAFTYLGANVGNSAVIGTVANTTGPNNPTNGWLDRGRATLTSAATAGSHARLSVSPKIRWPETTTTLYGGWRIVFTWAPKDAVTAVGFIGLHQNTIVANTAPSAYTGSRWGLMYDPALTGADTNLKLYNGASLIQDFGASFPGNGNENNAYQFDITCRPFPNYGVTYTLTNLISGATATGTTTNIPLGTFDPIVSMVRDNQATATAVVMSTCGMFGNAWSALVVGDSTLQIPSPLTLTGNTTLTKTIYGDVEVFANAATPITLTVDPTGYVPGDRLYGTNIGVGTVAFAAGSGVTINQHADVSATVAQYKGWSLVCTATNTWVRLA